MTAPARRKRATIVASAVAAAPHRARWIRHAFAGRPHRRDPLPKRAVRPAAMRRSLPALRVGGIGGGARLGVIHLDERSRAFAGRIVDAASAASHSSRLVISPRSSLPAELRMVIRPLSRDMSFIPSEEGCVARIPRCSRCRIHRFSSSAPGRSVSPSRSISQCGGSRNAGRAQPYLHSVAEDGALQRPDDGDLSPARHRRDRAQRGIAARIADGCVSRRFDGRERSDRSLAVSRRWPMPKRRSLPITMAGRSTLPVDLAVHARAVAALDRRDATRTDDSL